MMTGEIWPRNRPSSMIRWREEEHVESQEEAPQEDGEAQAQEEAQEESSQEACPLDPPAAEAVWRFHD